MIYLLKDNDEMIWNHIIYIGLGFFGSNIFTWSLKGLFVCSIFIIISQLMDMLRIYLQQKKLILASPPEIRDMKMKAFKNRLVYKLFQVYLLKVIYYLIITMISASVTRYLMAPTIQGCLFQSYFEVTEA